MGTGSTSYASATLSTFSVLLHITYSSEKGMVQIKINKSKFLNKVRKNIHKNSIHIVKELTIFKGDGMRHYRSEVGALYIGD